MHDARINPNSVSLGFLPGPSSPCDSFFDLASLPQRHAIGPSTPVEARCAKRPKTIGGYSVPKEIDCSSLCESPIPHPNTSRLVTRGSRTFCAPFSGTSASQQIPLGTSGQSSVSSSLDPALDDDTNPEIPPQVSEFSIRTGTPGLQMKAVHPRRKKPNMPSTFISDNSSVIGLFSPPPVSPSHNEAALGSTTPDSRGRNNSKFVESSPHLSPEYGIPKAILTAAACPGMAAHSSLRLSDGPHEAGCIGEDPVPRMPAGFNTPVHVDISSITSPADVSSGELHHASGGSHTPSLGQPSSSNLLIPDEPQAPKAVSRVSRSGRASRSAGNGSKEVKQKLITPLEYAQRLQSCFDPHVEPKTNYLKGKRIFYVGGDMMYASTTTRRRMEYVSLLASLLTSHIHIRLKLSRFIACRHHLVSIVTLQDCGCALGQCCTDCLLQIVKHGGTLVPKYDPATVTHIVTDAGIRHTLQALLLKSLSDIPDSIPTVTWNWVVSGYGRATKRKLKLSLDGDDRNGSEEDRGDGNESDPLDFEFMHAAFSERIDAGRKWKKIPRGKQALKTACGPALGADDTNDDNGDISHISYVYMQGLRNRHLPQLQHLFPGVWTTPNRRAWCFSHRVTATST